MSIRVPMNLVVRTVLFMLAVCGALRAQTTLSGQSAEQATVRAPAYVFAPSGSFAGIQRDFKLNSLWYLSRVEGITPLLPPACHPDRADCFWYPASIVYDASTAMVYAVLPQKQSSSPNDPAEWQVVAFKLPEMAVVAHFALPNSENPELLLRPDHQELFVNYTLPKPPGQPAFETVVDVYETPSLKKKNSIHEKIDEQKFMMAQAIVNASFSHAEFDRSGDVILSGLSRITFTNTAFHKENVDPVALLDPAEKRKLEPFYRIQPANNTRWLPQAVADFNNGRALMVSESQDGAQMAMWSVNLENSKASPVSIVPAGDAHLIGRGTRILVEKIKPGPGSASRSENNEKFGNWTIYDTATGQQVMQKEVAIAKGRALQNELICAWPDGSRALYRHDNKLYGVVLSTTGGAQEIPAAFSAVAPLHCIFVP
jgi:hypothetical protein